MSAKPNERNRADYARYAEALKITTDSVVSVQTDDGGKTYTVLYTLGRTRNPNDMLFRALLWTNIEGNLEVIQARQLCTLGRFATQVAMIESGIEVPLGTFEQMDEITWQ